MQTNKKTPYGEGFNDLPFMADYKSFLSWWNSESWFPVDEEEFDVERDFPIAA